MDSVQKVLARLKASESDKKAKLFPFGKLTARERLTTFFDEQSFTEIGAFIKRNADAEPSDFEGIVAGYGAVDGRLVYAFSQDYSVMNGAVGAAQFKKILALYDMAEKNPAPVVAMLDSNGAKLTEGLLDALYGYGEIVRRASTYRGAAPQIALVMGVCGGSAALYANACDFMIMDEQNGRLFITPPSVAKVLHKDAADFGTASACLQNGNAALMAKGENAVLSNARRLLGFLPTRCGKGAFYTESEDDLNRPASGFETVDDSFDLDAAITSLADDGNVLPVYISGSVATCFVTLGFQTVGIIATDIRVNDGYLLPDDLFVAAKFAQALERMGLPALVLVNTKGFDAKAEASGSPLITAASTLANVFSSFSAPLVSVVIGKVWGAAFPLFASKAIGADLAFSLENALISLMNPLSAVEFLWNDKIAALNNPITDKDTLVNLWNNTVASPIAAAYDGKIDAILSPGEIRQRLIAAFDMLSSKI